MQIPRWLFWRLPLFKAVAYATIQIDCQEAFDMGKGNVVVPSGQVSDERTEDRCSKALNIEQQNKEPQNDEVNTSIFPPEADSIFCGSKRR